MPNRIANAGREERRRGIRGRKVPHSGCNLEEEGEEEGEEHQMRISVEGLAGLVFVLAYQHSMSMFNAYILSGNLGVTLLRNNLIQKTLPK